GPGGGREPPEGSSTAAWASTGRYRTGCGGSSARQRRTVSPIPAATISVESSSRGLRRAPVNGAATSTPQSVPGRRGRDEHAEARGGQRAGGERAGQVPLVEVGVDDEVKTRDHDALVEERSGQGPGVAGRPPALEDQAREQEARAA